MTRFPALFEILQSTRPLHPPAPLCQLRLKCAAVDLPATQPTTDPRLRLMAFSTGFITSCVAADGQETVLTLNMLLERGRPGGRLMVVLADLGRGGLVDRFGLVTKASPADPILQIATAKVESDAAGIGT